MQSRAERSEAGKRKKNVEQSTSTPRSHGTGISQPGRPQPGRPQPGGQGGHKLVRATETAPSPLDWPFLSAKAKLPKVKLPKEFSEPLNLKELRCFLAGTFEENDLREMYGSMDCLKEFKGEIANADSLNIIVDKLIGHIERKMLVKDFVEALPKFYREHPKKKITIKTREFTITVEGDLGEIQNDRAKLEELFKDLIYLMGIPEGKFYIIGAFPGSIKLVIHVDEEFASKYETKLSNLKEINGRQIKEISQVTYQNQFNLKEYFGLIDRALGFIYQLFDHKDIDETKNIDETYINVSKINRSLFAYPNEPDEEVRQLLQILNQYLKGGSFEERIADAKLIIQYLLKNEIRLKESLVNLQQK